MFEPVSCRFKVSTVATRLQRRTAAEPQRSQILGNPY